MNALDHLVLRQLRLWNAAYACRVEIRLFGLDAAKAAQFLVSLFLPLCYQVRIPIPLLEQPVVQIGRNCFTLVVHIIDVSRPLMVYLKDRRQCPLLRLALVRIVLS